MGVLDFLNPFSKTMERVVDVVDKAILDKDLAVTIKGELQALEMQGQRLETAYRLKQIELDAALNELKEKSYQLELQTVTIPWVDAFHKLSRTSLSFFNITVNGAIVLTFGLNGIPINGDIMAILGLGNAVSGTYIYRKGEGKPVA